MLKGVCNFRSNISSNIEKGTIFSDTTVSISGKGFATKINGIQYAISLDGEIYNKIEIERDLNLKGFKPSSIEEILILSYYVYGKDFIKKLQGPFAIALWDGTLKRLLLARDHLGIMPLFYTIGDSLNFALHIDPLIQQENEVDIMCLKELFALGPARTPGKTFFKNINEILPGNIATYSNEGISFECYWSLAAVPHVDNFEDTISTIKTILTNSIITQTDENVCSLLSGGVDSTIVTAIASEFMQKKYGKKLSTYSFDYVDNNKHFKESSFQPQEDRPFVEKAVSALNTQHTFLELDTSDLVSYLYTSVNAKGMPGMGDIDSSMLAFLRKIKGNHSAFLTGEGADEIFVGYPWFFNTHLNNDELFPWSKNVYGRTFFLNDSLKNMLNIEQYIRSKFKESLANTPLLQDEDEDEKKLKQVIYVNSLWFMSTLIDRTQRAAYFLDMQPRLPYASPSLAQYLYNVPSIIKIKDNIPKFALRHAYSDIIPKEISNRKKSPFPKTYNPSYSNALVAILNEEVLNKNAPLYPFIKEEEVKQMVTTHDQPWFGQLMKGPQQMAYLIQINYWLKKYNIKIKL